MDIVEEIRTDRERGAKRLDSSFVSTSDWNWPGTVPATFDEAASASAQYGIESGYSCFVNPAQRSSLPGSRIVVEGYLFSKFTDPYDVGTAHLLPGGGFRLNGANACFSGSANAPITIDMSSYTPSATAEAFDLVSFPAGADVSDFNASAFTLANGTSARVTYGGTLFVRDVAGGGKDLSLSVPSASEFVSRVKGVASTPDYPGYSEFDHTADASGKAFWSDGNLPDSPGTDYFSDGVTLVPPVSSENVGTFGGRCLILRNASLQQGAVSVGFHVPDLRFSGNCGIRLWNSAGIWSTDFRDENGAQYRSWTCHRDSICGGAAMSVPSSRFRDM